MSDTGVSRRVRAVPRAFLGNTVNRVAGRRCRWVVAVVVAVVALVAGCSGGGAAKPAGKKSAASPAAAASPAPGTLRLLVTPGYVEDGGTNPSINWVSDFEARTNCHVDLRNATDDSSAVHDMTEPGSQFDGVLGSPTVTGELIAAKDAAPLRVSGISGYQSLSPRLRNAPGMGSGGTVYAMPYLWDTYVVGYDPGHVRPAPTGWAALFSPASASRYGGKIMLPGRQVTIALAALYLKSARPSLGITDPFELTRAQFNAAVGALNAVKGDVSMFWSGDGGVIGQLGDGQDVLGGVMSHQIGAMSQGGLSTASVPAHSAGGAARSVVYTESWVKSAHAPDPGCMDKWLSWMNSQYVQERASSWTGLAPARPAACAGVRAICDQFQETKLGSAANLVFDHLPASACGNGRNGCVPYDQWVSAWRQFVPGFVP